MQRKSLPPIDLSKSKPHLKPPKPKSERRNSGSLTHLPDCGLRSKTPLPPVQTDNWRSSSSDEDTEKEGRKWCLAGWQRSNSAVGAEVESYTSSGQVLRPLNGKRPSKTQVSERKTSTKIQAKMKKEATSPPLFRQRPRSVSCTGSKMKAAVPLIKADGKERSNSATGFETVKAENYPRRVRRTTLAKKSIIQAVKQSIVPTNYFQNIANRRTISFLSSEEKKEAGNSSEEEEEKELEAKDGEDLKSLLENKAVTTSEEKQEGKILMKVETVSHICETLCLLCRRSLPNKLSLQVHLHVHRHPLLSIITSEKYRISPSYECVICSKHLASFTTARLHTCYRRILRQVTTKLEDMKGMPFVCVRCTGRQFLSRTDLFLHLSLMHSNPCAGPSNHCPICGAIFKSDNLAAIEQHMVHVHRAEFDMTTLRILHKDTGHSALPTSNPADPFVCLFPEECYPHPTSKGKVKNCSRTFDRIWELQAHYENNHLRGWRRRGYWCTRCNTQFSSSSAHVAHVNGRHKKGLQNKSELISSSDNNICFQSTCIKCWKKFPSAIELTAHIIISHASRSFRKCDACDRELFECHEVVSMQVMYNVLMAHERHHAEHIKDLDDQFQGEFFGQPTANLFEEGSGGSKDIVKRQYYKVLDLKKFFFLRERPISNNDLPEQFYNWLHTFKDSYKCNVFTDSSFIASTLGDFDSTFQK